MRWRDVNEECDVMWDTRGCESCVRDVMTSSEESVISHSECDDKCEEKRGVRVEMRWWEGGEWGGGGEAAERSDITPN